MRPAGDRPDEDEAVDCTAHLAAGLAVEAGLPSRRAHIRGRRPPSAPPPPPRRQATCPTLELDAEPKDRRAGGGRRRRRRQRWERFSVREGGTDREDGGDGERQTVEGANGGGELGECVVGGGRRGDAIEKAAGAEGSVDGVEEQRTAWRHTEVEVEVA